MLCLCYEIVNWPQNSRRFQCFIVVYNFSLLFIPLPPNLSSKFPKYHSPTRATKLATGEWGDCCDCWWLMRKEGGRGDGVIWEREWLACRFLRMEKGVPLSFQNYTNLLRLHDLCLSYMTSSFSILPLTVLILILGVSRINEMCSGLLVRETIVLEEIVIHIFFILYVLRPRNSFCIEVV